MNNRQSIRLKGYDYSQPGYYFITLCTQNRAHRFGKISDGVMRLTTMGQIVTNEWNQLITRFDNITLDAFVVMPNHVHGIITVGVPLAGTLPPRGTAVGDIVGAYKSLCVNKILKWINKNDPSMRLGQLWQRNYWEHIIRNQQALENIRQYIRNNSIKWQEDRFMGNQNNLREEPAVYGDDQVEKINDIDSSPDLPEIISEWEDIL